MARSGNASVPHVRTGRVQRLVGYFLPLLASALLLALCYPRPGWGTLAHVALVPVAALALRSRCAWRLAWTSYLVSLLWWLYMLRWLVPVTGSGLVLLAALMAVYLPASLLVVRLLYLRWRLPMVVALPMAVVSFELVRSYWPAGGFSWFMLGHALAPYHQGHSLSRLIQIADLFGDHGVSFLVAMTSGVIVDMLTIPWLQLKAPTRFRRYRKLVFPILLWSVSMGSAWGYGQYRINTADNHPGPSIAVIQTNVPHDNKRLSLPKQRKTDWQTLLALTRDALRQEPKPQIVIWPETVVPGPINEEFRKEYLLDWIHEDIETIVKQAGVNLIVGAPTLDDKGRYNSVYLYRGDGTQAPRRYDKVHRVPFGEYIPWVESWPWLKQIFVKYISPYRSDYTLMPGRRFTVFQTGRFGAVTPICFEDTFARVCRQMVYDQSGAKRADLIFNLTNDSWYWFDQRPQHLQIAVFRSIENRVPTARSVNTGISGFISSLGRVGPIVAPNGVNPGPAGFVVHAVEIDQRNTTFGKIGHLPAIAVAVVTALLTLTTKLRRKEGR